MSTSAGLRGGVGPVGLFALGFGTMIGVGWITALGALVGAGGPVGAPLAFALAAVALVPVGLCYAEVGALYPETGGEVAYALKVFGEGTAFAVGWLLVLAYTATVAFEAISVGWIGEAIIPSLAGPVAYEFAGYPVRLGNLAIGLVTMIVIGWLNWRGATAATGFQNALTFLLIGASAIFVIAGLIRGEAAHLAPAFPPATAPVQALAAVLAITPFFYAGFNTIPQALGEARKTLDLSRLGQAMTVTILGAGVFYVLIVLTAVLSMPRDELMVAPLPAAAAFEAALASSHWAKLVLFAGWLGLITTWNAVLFAGARALFALGQRGSIPAWFGRVNVKHGSPGNAVVFIVLVATCLTLGGRGAVMPIVGTTAAVFAGMFLFTSVTFAVTRRSRSALVRPYRAPAGWTVAASAIVVSTAMLTLALRESWLSKSAGTTLPAEWWVIGFWLLLGGLLRVATVQRGASV